MDFGKLPPQCLYGASPIMGGCLQLVVYYYFYTAPPHPHPQHQHTCSHAYIYCMLYAHAGAAQRAMLLLPCTCSCGVPNGNAADIDSSIMRLSAGVAVLVYWGGKGIYFMQVQVLYMYNIYTVYISDAGNHARRARLKK